MGRWRGTWGVLGELGDGLPFADGFFVEVVGGEGVIVGVVHGLVNLNFIKDEVIYDIQKFELLILHSLT